LIRVLALIAVEELRLMTRRLVDIAPVKYPSLLS
jgi:hypothetical protein